MTKLFGKEPMHLCFGFQLMFCQPVALASNRGAMASNVLVAPQLLSFCVLLFELVRFADLQLSKGGLHATLVLWPPTH